jgi:predicted Zn-dependent peptidase
MKTSFKRKVLENGMTILFEKRDLPVVSVAFAVRQGGINEDAGEKGISHFIEHLLYKGTSKRNTKQIAEEIERNGGELNGFTSENITAFWCKMPSEHLSVALDVLSDMVKNPRFDEKDIEKERQVIFEEIKMYKDNPRLHVFDEIHRSLYEPPFGIPLIGTYESMNSVDKKKMTDTFKKVYTPDNMVLAVVGDADFDDIVKFAEKNFGKEKASPKNFKISPKDEIRMEKRKGIDQANLIFAYHTPLIGKKGAYAAKLLSALMAEGMSSRLFEEIRNKRNLAYSVRGDTSLSKNFSHSVIYVGTTKENVEKVKKLILEEFNKVAKGLTEKELKQIKKQVIGNYKISMEDSQGQMVALLLYEMDGDASKYYDFEKNISAVKLDEVKNLAKLKKYSFFALVPDE